MSRFKELLVAKRRAQWQEEALRNYEQNHIVKPDNGTVDRVFPMQPIFEAPVEKKTKQQTEKKKVLDEEFIRKVQPVGSLFPDETLLMDLSYISQENPEHPTSQEWINLKPVLTPEQRGVFTSLLRRYSKRGITTLKELRESDTSLLVRKAKSSYYEAQLLTDIFAPIEDPKGEN